MARKGLKEGLKGFLFAKLGIATALIAFYFGAKNHSIVKRVEDTLLYMNVPVAKNSFPDPSGLEIRTEINRNGEKEVYIMHIESGKKIAIGYDMLPKDLEILAQGLENRLYNSRYGVADPERMRQYPLSWDELKARR